ncbi:MAG: hypothetical protein QM728_12965 [Gordonia sp. (in: high G+C Gram-positive bacteria)]|uniref:hypothetical protein n=1 Tax=Gordonia sp. (in: high G+C Gram-positive bacteria) TaxID=84139 RepID=UPI0039E38642
MVEDFEAVRRRRQKIAGTVLLVVFPIVLFLVLLSFGMQWVTALGITLLALVVAFGRWRLKYGVWPWQAPG